MAGTGQKLSGLLIARRRRRSTADLLIKSRSNDAAPVVFDDWLYDADTGGAASIVSAGIASGESFGSPALSVGLVSAGIASSEAFGQPTVTPVVSAHDVVSLGIASSEAIGSPVVATNVAGAGIATSEALGSPSVSVSVSSAGIASSEAFGTPSVGITIPSVGVVSEESFGLPVISAVGGVWTIESVGIPSEEAFGYPTVGDIQSGYSQEIDLTLQPRPKPQHVAIEELAEQLEELEAKKVEIESEIKAAKKKKNVAKIKTPEYDELKTYIYLLSLELNTLTVDLSGLQEQIRAMQAIEERLAWQQSLQAQNMMELDMAFVMAMMVEACD